MPDIHLLSTPDEVAEWVASTTERLAAEAVRDRGRVSLALTGGSVATRCLPRLAEAHIEWPRTYVVFGDDRAVPADAEDSNYRLAHALLFSRVPLPAAHILRMRGEAPDLDAAAADYEAALVETLGTPPVIDLVLLGVGEDGHVCSLFPGQTPSPAVAGWVAAVADAPKPPPRRLTLTMPALLAARHIVVAVMGRAKAAVVREASSEPGSALPLAQVLRGGHRVDLVLDREAAEG